MIVKHTNPCGIATRGDLLEAYRLAVRADPVSAFGGIVAFNREVDAELAKEIREFRYCLRFVPQSVSVGRGLRAKWNPWRRLFVSVNFSRSMNWYEVTANRWT